MLRYPLFLLCLALPLAPVGAATLIAPSEDVMTSSFFFGPDFVRGYDGDSRPAFRVSTEDPFGTSGAETIYITFDPADFTGFTAPVAGAVLTVESIDGGFSANAGPGNPFTVSAHGVSADPLTGITDDTNPSGPIGWSDFYSDNVLSADPAAVTVVEGFGSIEFDVTALVNDWLTGATPEFTVALTGKNDASGNDFLHGFANNSESPGSTFLTVTAVPEPASLLIGILACVAAVGRTARPTLPQHQS